MLNAKSYKPLNDVELSCLLGVRLAGGGGQKVFLGTGNQVVLSPSLRCDSSRMNLPSLKNLSRPPGWGKLWLALLLTGPDCPDCWEESSSWLKDCNLLSGDETFRGLAGFLPLVLTLPMPTAAAADTVVGRW